MLPIFVINMDDDHQRLTNMSEQLSALGLQWERIPAVDGAALTQQMLFDENRRARQRKLSAGEMGCLHSHVLIWRRIVEGQDQAALVLEDDVLLAPDVALIAKDPSWLLSIDCIVRLETYCMPVVLGSQAKLVNGRGLYPLRSHHYGSAAYIITRERALAMLRVYHECVEIPDNLMFRYPLHHNVYQVDPAPCIQYLNYKHGLYFNGEDSRLAAQRLILDRQSWHDPLITARRLKWKIGSVAKMGFDLARGHNLRTVPYG